VLEAIPVLVAVVSLVFALINLAPGDVSVSLAGERMQFAQTEAVRERYGLNRPLVYRWWSYMLAVAKGDFGDSLAYQEPAMRVVFERVGPTLVLMLSAQIIGLLSGVGLGLFAALRHGSRVDALLSGISLMLFSLPVFWVGLMSIVLFGVILHWLPTGGMVDLRVPAIGWGRVLDVLRHLVLPASALAIVWTFPLYFRFTRSALVDVLGEDYIRTARAKGLHGARLLLRHVLRNAMIPVVTVASIWLGLTFSGAVFTETVFTWPGLGRLMFESIFTRDFPVLVAVFTITAIAVVVASIVADLVYAAIDPRITYS
jgi:peptide/nickel transport system permease protein